MQNNPILFTQITLEDLGKFIEEKVRKAVEKIALTTTSKDEKTFYTREEVSKLLDVSFTTLFHWNNKSILKARKIGKRVYYSKNDVLDLLNS